MPGLEVDLAVIGFGKAGKTLAATLARAGRRVAMIEQSDRMYGGTCINIGCVPTKAMVYLAEHVDPHVAADEWFAQASTRTSALTSAMRAANLAMLTAPRTSMVITGRARLADPHTIHVASGDDHVDVIADTIVINTGAVPIVPPELATSSRVVTSTGMLGLTSRPRALVVVGGGYVGVEFAAMNAAFGADVTVIQRRDRLLPREDPDISAEVEQLLRDAGVRVVTGARVSSVTDEADATTVTYGLFDGTGGTARGEVVLAAVGRRPATDDLGLNGVGIATDDRGAIIVDERLRTSLDHVYAVGDVNGGPQFTYVSLDDYRIVLDQLTGTGARSTRDRVAVPHVVFTTPPLARVGVTELEARATGRRLTVATRRVSAMATVPRARIVSDPRGVMKAVVDADTDEILGVALLAHDAHEMVNTVALAMRAGITATQLRDSIYTHPSMTEALNDLFANLASSGHSG